MGALDTRRRRSWIAGSVLLAPGTFVQQWTAQQANIPFAYCARDAIYELYMA